MLLLRLLNKFNLLCGVRWCQHRRRKALQEKNCFKENLNCNLFYVVTKYYAVSAFTNLQLRCKMCDKIGRAVEVKQCSTKLLESLLPFRTFPSLNLNPKTDLIGSLVIMSTVFTVIVGSRISLKVIIALQYFGRSHIGEIVLDCIYIVGYYYIFFIFVCTNYT